MRKVSVYRFSGRKKNVVRVWVVCVGLNVVNHEGMMMEEWEVVTVGEQPCGINHFIQDLCDQTLSDRITGAFEKAHEY
ncbi:hypothetical protein DEO72_LG5g1222 [Vigna unguiculata]|uniref:Uncharacterized protein n=1 Tax=Vigna unguiculata TaxID=3917 RepID=A0A4D6LXQ2_VIGUN|nr:hypothetical protein DEO72_LG5g1220 [Vigna unguiculata]QCD93151.1 hypothetical protein DEO72_LG5g1222 [Vigna unguiculata]